jgi:hypothetical protein
MGEYGMRKRIQEMSWAFDDICEQIKDIHEVLKLYEERLEESAETEVEFKAQSILRGQLKLLELAEKDCEDFSERVDEFLRDYVHGRLNTLPEK